MIVSSKEKAAFIRNLAIMIRSGLSLSEAFEIIVKQSKGGFKEVVKKMLDVISAGNSLSSAAEQFPKIFKNYYISAIKSGEDSGNLESNLFNLADQIDKANELKSKIRAAMVYPAVVLVLSIVIGFLLTLYVLPKITPLFTGLDMELPFLTKVLIAFSDFMKDNGFMVALVFIFFVAVFFRLIRIRPIKVVVHKLFLAIPLVSIISKSKNISQFSYTLGIMIKSGLSFDEALHISADTLDNLHYQKIIKDIRQRVSEGNSLAESMEYYHKYFPIMAIGMIRVGEKSGSLDDELIDLSQIYESDNDNAIRSLASSIEPILLIVIGSVIGLLAVAVITPIYKITGGVYR